MIDLWNNNEIEVLKSNYILEGDNNLPNLLGKSPNAIRIKASRLGISKFGYKANITLSSLEEQVILGGLMGDLYCRIREKNKNAQIQGAHCKKQEDYLLWKVNILKSLSFSFRRNKAGYLFFDSKNYPCLNEYYHLFYKNGKKTITEEVLNKIETFGLAIWYMDDGSYSNRDKSSRLYTNGFTYDENLLIKKWFENRWGVFPKITIYKDEKRCPGRVRYFLTFNVRETKKLIDMIRNYIHPSMNYKIGETFEIKSETNNGA